MKGFKNYIRESSEAGGADYESAIVMGYYSAQGLEIPDASALDISSTDYNKVLKDPLLKKAGEEIAKDLLKSNKIPKKKSAKQTGRASYDLTPEWKKTGANNKTPKTDLLIGNSRISLKIGPAQLMSGGKAESLATFNAALAENKNLSKSKEVKEIVEAFEGFVSRGLTQGGNVNDYIKGKKKGKDEIIANGDKAHKMMIEKLNSLFEKSEDFKVSFAKEAMSGIHKFGPKSEATAEYFLVGSKAGDPVSYHSIEDMSYVRKVASVMKPTVRFKSVSQKASIEGKKTKTGNYSYWSVVSLIVSKMDALSEEYEADCERMISENREMHPALIREKAFSEYFAKFKEFISKIIRAVVNFISSKIENLIEFLSPEEPEISVNGLDSTVVMPL